MTYKESKHVILEPVVLESSPHGRSGATLSGTPSRTCILRTEASLPSVSQCASLDVVGIVSQNRLSLLLRMQSPESSALRLRYCASYLP